MKCFNILFVILLLHISVVSAEAIDKRGLLQKGNEFLNKGMAAEQQGEYPLSIEYFQKYLAITEKIYGKEDISVFFGYSRLSSLNRTLGNYPKALEYQQKAVTIQEKVLGVKHPDTAFSYSLLGSLYQTMGDDSNALKYKHKALTIQEKVLGTEHSDTAFSYSVLGSIYRNMGDNSNALKYKQKALSIQEKVLGAEHPDTAFGYDSLGSLYQAMGDDANALKYKQKTLVIQEKLLGSDHQDTFRSYSRIGSLYQSLKNYSKALEFYHKALAITEKVSGKEHRDTASSYNSLGSLYSDMEDYPKAFEYYKKALDIRERVLGEKHRNTADSHSSLGFLYHTSGDYLKAVEHNLKVLAIMEMIYGQDHFEIVDSYIKLGMNYQLMGEFPKAIESTQKALSITEKIYGKEHIEATNSYIMLGATYQIMGDFPKALDYFLKALDIKEKVLGKGHPELALNYTSLASIYQFTEEYPRALDYSKKSLEIIERNYGEKHSNTASNYASIGSIYQALEDYPKALKYYQKALLIREQILGKDNPLTAASYVNLGAVYKDMREYPKALEFYQKAVAITEQVLGKDNHLTGVNYYLLGFLYQTMEDYLRAHHYAKLSFDIFLKNRDKNFSILDSNQKEKYLKTKSGYISLLLKSSSSYLFQLDQEKKTSKSQQLLQSDLNAWINYKGSIFDSENSIAMLYSNTDDTKLKSKIDDLVSSKRVLAKLYQSLPKSEEREAWQKKIKLTEQKISRLTNEIASKATSFKEQQGLRSISYKDITAQLKDDELYIDYAKAGSHYYLFSIDNKEQITFVQIDEKSTFDIDWLVKEFRAGISIILNDKNVTNEKLKTLASTSKEILSRLFELLLKKPLENQLKSKPKLIISPDGALRLLPFEALFDQKNQKYFIEEKEIRYIPSGKELVRLYKYSKDKAVESSSVIFANPSFNTEIASVSKEEIAITPNTNRSGIIKSLYMMRFAPLPGTKAEAIAIEGILDKENILNYQDDKATESNLMKIKEPRLLHIATHGFFINDPSMPNPMLKSGIALAGANNSAIKGKSDGIVTALKLSGLNLKGTDLVVLSACETGVVDINETESVSGLSKAFILAGAKDIVVSLWTVNDQATKELMISFYQEMKQTPSYAKALKAAKLKMIENDIHPFYWAAFVVNGL